jgi:hypothetical protein
MFCRQDTVWMGLDYTRSNGLGDLDWHRGMLMYSIDFGE